MDLSREPWNTGACVLCRRGYAAKVPLQIHHGQSLKTRTVQRIGPCRSEGRVWAEPTNTGPGTEFLAGSQGSALSPRRGDCHSSIFAVALIPGKNLPLVSEQIPDTKPYKKQKPPWRAVSVWPVVRSVASLLKMLYGFLLPESLCTGSVKLLSFHWKSFLCLHCL